MLDFKVVLVVFISLTMLACSPEEEAVCIPSKLTVDDARPDVLVIGDSISIGYFPTIATALSSYDVLHNPCNAQNSRNGVKRINDWLSMRDQWEVITFNHGQWDIWNGAGVPLEEYKTNLRSIAELIKTKTSKPLFVLTTQVPLTDPYRDQGDEIPYNEAAVEIMNELGIPVVDLYTVSLSLHHLHVSDGIHYTSQGSEILGEEILGGLTSIYGISY